MEFLSEAYIQNVFSYNPTHPLWGVLIPVLKVLKGSPDKSSREAIVQVGQEGVGLCSRFLLPKCETMVPSWAHYLV